MANDENFIVSAEPALAICNFPTKGATVTQLVLCVATIASSISSLLIFLCLVFLQYKERISALLNLTNGQHYNPTDTEYQPLNRPILFGSVRKRPIDETPIELPRLDGGESG